MRFIVCSLFIRKMLGKVMIMNLNQELEFDHDLQRGLSMLLLFVAVPILVLIDDLWLLYFFKANFIRSWFTKSLLLSFVKSVICFCWTCLRHMDKQVCTHQKRKGGELQPKVWMLANIHTFCSSWSPPFRFWLVIYTAYAAPQLLGLYLAF